MEKRFAVGVVLAVLVFIAIAFMSVSQPKVEWTAKDRLGNVYSFESYSTPLNENTACTVAMIAAKNLPGGAPDFDCNEINGPDVPKSAPWIVESTPKPVAPTEFMPDNTVVIHVEIDESTLTVTVRQDIKGEVFDFI